MSEIKKTVTLKWKDFDVNLELLETWCRANVPSYVGNQAAARLELFLSEDSEEQAKAIREQWELVDEEHDWAANYVSQEDLKARALHRAEAVKQLKLGMLEKTWANMSAVERKLYLGLDAEASDKELGLE